MICVVILKPKKTKKSTVAKLYSNLHGARHPIFKILIDQGIVSP